MVVVEEDEALVVECEVLFYFLLLISSLLYRFFLKPHVSLRSVKRGPFCLFFCDQTAGLEFVLTRPYIANLFLAVAKEATFCEVPQPWEKKRKEKTPKARERRGL